MAFHDLRSFLHRLEGTGSLLRVGDAIDPDLESTSLCQQALRAQGPALLFEHPKGSAHPLLGNLFGHRDRIEAALGGRPEWMPGINAIVAVRLIMARTGTMSCRIHFALS